MLRPFCIALRLSFRSSVVSSFPAKVGNCPLRTVCLTRFLRPCPKSALPMSSGHVRLFSTPSRSQEQPDEPKSSLESDDGSEDLMMTLNEAEQRRFKIIMLEFDVFSSTGSLVPEKMTCERWQKILQECPTVSSRKRMYTFWFKLDKKKEHEQTKKEERYRIHQEREADYERRKAEGTVEYPDRILLRVLSRSMNQSYYSNLAFSMTHGVPLVFDLQYNEHMTNQELSNLTDQILLAHGTNKLQREPFHLVLCNAGPDNSVIRHITEHKLLDLDKLPITVTGKSSSDLFPRKDLVYLSPNARQVMKKFDPHDVFVIGGIVDKSKEEPLTFAQAKKDKVRAVKLPLDQYLDWNIGSKSLTLDQMMKIMLEIRESNDWNKAFMNVPRRKLRRR